MFKKSAKIISAGTRWYEWIVRMIFKMKIFTTKM